MRSIGMISRVPMWGKVASVGLSATGLTLLATGAGITGDNPIKVQEPVTMTSGTSVTGDDDLLDAVLYNDDTSMSVSAATYPGDTHVVKLELKNHSGVSQAQRLFVESPEGFRFSSELCDGDNADACVSPSDSELTVAQEDAKSFVFTAASTTGDTSDADDTLYIVVETMPQVAPGYYSWSMHTESLVTDTNFD